MMFIFFHKYLFLRPINRDAAKRPLPRLNKSVNVWLAPRPRLLKSNNCELFWTRCVPTNNENNYRVSVGHSAVLTPFVDDAGCCSYQVGHLLVSMPVRRDWLLSTSRDLGDWRGCLLCLTSRDLRGRLSWLNRDGWNIRSTILYKKK